jgi:hypothetical protein
MIVLEDGLLRCSHHAHVGLRTLFVRRVASLFRYDRSCWMRMRCSALTCSLAAFAVIAACSGNARADEGEASTEDVTLVRLEQQRAQLQLRPWRGLESRYGRELNWSRWMLSDVPTLDPDSAHRGEPWLDLADLRGDAWHARPEAASSAVSALGSVMTAGLPMIGVRRNSRIVQRHFLRGYFRSRGVSLVWRIEF